MEVKDYVGYNAFLDYYFFNLITCRTFNVFLLNSPK